MSSMFGAGLGFLVALPVLVAQWVGVIGLLRCGRNGAWWCMAIGTGLTTLGTIFSAVGIFLMMTSSSIERLAIYLTVIGGVSGLGSLMFMIGFAIHGMQSRRIRERLEELELVLSAQSEQLERQNSAELS